MFIYHNWDSICQELSNLNTIRIDEILSQHADSNWVSIKHDVETDVSKALILAKIEAKYNIRATYFIQANLIIDNAKTLKEIQYLGHEVTYHYDVLDANRGDFSLAIDEFRTNIKLFHNFGFDIKTVCPHGNPLIDRKGWNSNKDFFRKEEIASQFSSILDIVVQLPKKIESSYSYISDAGYAWQQVVNIETNDINNKGDIFLGLSRDLLESIQNEKRVIVSTHPHRWERNSFKALLNLYRFKILRFIARKLSSISILKKIMSKFYFLAKKV